MVALLLVEFCSEAGERLGFFGEFVRFSSCALAESFVVVESVMGWWSAEIMAKKG